MGKAARTQIPRIVTFFGYFHFVQSMVKCACSMGLENQIRSQQIRRWFELIFVLPLLSPAEIPAAFNAVILRDDFSAILNDFFVWFAGNYLNGRFGTVKWSENFLLMHGFPKSKSFVESSHRKLNQIICFKQPKFYQVTNQLALRLIETESQWDWRSRRESKHFVLTVASASRWKPTRISPIQPPSSFV